MRCKPGDIAVFIKGRNYGRLCRVIRPTPEAFRQFPDDWEVESLSEIEYGSGRTEGPGRIGNCRDSYLRPLLDPGDDATDETLLWKPVPVKETA